MSDRSLKDLFKFAFRLLVSEQWEKIREIVEGNDVTYRWTREQIRREIKRIEWTARSTRGSGHVASVAFILEQRFKDLKHVTPNEEDIVKAKHFLRFRAGKLGLKDEKSSTADRMNACKFALIEAAFIYFNEPQAVTDNFRDLLTELWYIEEVYFAIEEKTDSSILAQVKLIDDAAREYILGLGQELGEWPEFDIPAEALPSAPKFEPPEIWCFGDYGQADGQMTSPERVAIDKEGQFLVLEENTIGMGDIVTIQRIQLFSAKGKFLKCLLKRGEGKVNGMFDLCLTQDGNILVVDKDDDDKARIQIFDYHGKQLLKITPEARTPDASTAIVKLPGEEGLEDHLVNVLGVEHPYILTVAVDPDGKIIAGDQGSKCIHVFAPDGKIVCRFGKLGIEEGEFQRITHVACDDAGKIYVYDSVLERVQVFDGDGNFLTLFGPSGIHSSFMLFDAVHGEVYCADVLNHKVTVYSMAGEMLRENGKHGEALDECSQPYSLALMPDGRVAIAEKDNHRISVLKI